MGVGQPVVDRRPADLRGEAGEEQEVRDQRIPRVYVLECAPGEGIEPVAWRTGCENDDAEQSDAEAERGEDQVLPRRLQRPRLPAEADEERRRGGRRLHEKPGPAE